MTFVFLDAAQIVARNVVPLAGILLLGWSAQNVLIVYFVDTLLSITVLFAGTLRKFAPPIEDDGWAARLNGEVGMIGGALFIACMLAFPLGLPSCSCSAVRSTGRHCGRTGSCTSASCGNARRPSGRISVFIRRCARPRRSSCA